MAVRLAAQQNDHLPNDFVYIDQFFLRSTLLEEQAHPADDIGCARRIFDDSRGRVARLCQIGLLAAKPSQASLGVGDRRCDRLLDFVRQGGSQLSMVVTRLTWARSAFAWRNASSARVRSVRSRTAPETSVPSSVSSGLRLISTGNSVPSFRRP